MPTRAALFTISLIVLTFTFVSSARAQSNSVCGWYENAPSPFFFVYGANHLHTGDDPARTQVTYDLVISLRFADGLHPEIQNSEPAFYRLYNVSPPNWRDTAPPPPDYTAFDFSGFECVDTCAPATPTPTPPPTLTPTRQPTATPSPPRSTPTLAPTSTTPAGPSFKCSGFGRCSQPTPTPLPDELGRKLEVTSSLNLRRDPSVNALRLRTLPAGTRLFILSGPTIADNYTWWRIQTEATATLPSLTGWIADINLRPLHDARGAPQLQLLFDLKPLASDTPTVLYPNSLRFQIMNVGTAPFLLADSRAYQLDIILKSATLPLEAYTFTASQDPAHFPSLFLLPGDQLDIPITDPIYFFHHIPTHGFIEARLTTLHANNTRRTVTTDQHSIVVSRHPESALSCLSQIFTSTSIIFPATAPFAIQGAFATSLLQCSPGDHTCYAKAYFDWATSMILTIPDIPHAIRTASDFLATVNTAIEAQSTAVPTCSILGDAVGAYGQTWIRQMTGGQ